MATLCGLFGKTKQAYYKHKRKTFSELEVEQEILSQVAIYRAEMPIIGGLKLYYLVSSVLGDAMDMGRDKFLNLLHRHKLIICGVDICYIAHPHLINIINREFFDKIWILKIDVI